MGLVLASRVMYCELLLVEYYLAKVLTRLLKQAASGYK